jgi:RNA polymerase sigma factor (sigma-70 family)
VAALVGAGLDDLRQEAYLAACLAARSFAGPGDFESYAAVAARNRLRMMCRAAGERCREAQLVPLDGLDAEPHRDRRRERCRLGRLRKQLRQLARGLPKRQRQAVGLHLAGLNNCEVARELGLNEATVRIHLKRAVEALKARVSGSCPPEGGARPQPLKRLAQEGGMLRSVEARS